MVSLDELTTRLQLVRREMKRKKIDAFLVTHLSNLRYLTGLSLSAGTLLVTSQSAQLFLDGRYQEVGQSLSRLLKVLSPDDFKETLSSLRFVAFESSDVTVARLRSLQKRVPHIRWKETIGLIEEIRRQKSSSELACIRRASRITKSVLATIPSLLRLGISELELQHSIDDLARKNGAEGMAFTTIVAFGEHTSRPHHHATERVLLSTDLVQIDMGARSGGYCSDYSRVFFMAPPTPEQKKAFVSLKKAKKHAEGLVRPGVKPRELDLAARSALQTCGYDKEFCHSLGHGLGLDIHEMPSLSSRSNEGPLLAGEVITIEPGLYFPGQWGMRLEDTIFV